MEDSWEHPIEDNIEIYVKNKKNNNQIINLANKKTSLSEVLKNINIEFTVGYSPSGWTHKSLCPFPDHAEKTPSFSYNPKQNCFNCFGCHRAGQAVQFISFLSNRNQIEVAQDLLLRDSSHEQMISELEESNNQYILPVLLEYTTFLKSFRKNPKIANYLLFIQKFTWVIDVYIRKYALMTGTDYNVIKSIIEKLKNHITGINE